MCPKFKKRHLVSIFAITIIVLIFFCGIGAAAVSTVHNISGTNYSTIQAAINAAPDGDTIYVDSNTYKENVVVNKTGLILIGNDTGTGMPVVDAMGSGHAINITADGVTLDWFNTTNATGSDMAGIFLTSNNSEILNNTVNNNKYGIYLDFSRNNTVTNNTANDNTDTGIHINSSDYNNLNDNNASVNAATGINFLTSSNNTLTDNIVTSSGGYGIYFDSSINNALNLNTVNYNGNTGIHLGDSSNSTLTENIVNNNTKYGIELFYSSNSTLTRNTANNNTKNGIYMSNSIKNILTNNTAIDNKYTGIYLVSSSNSTFTNNTVNSNTGSGIHLDSSSNNNTLNGNNVNFNTNQGIYLSSSSNSNVFMSNNASLNDIHGIFLFSSIKNTLMDNTANLNVNSGIYLDFSKNNTLVNNTANDNGNTGIYINSSDGNNLNGTNASSNAAVGINLLTSSNNTLTDNIVTSSGGYGIFFDSSSNNTLTSNTVNDNTDTGIYLDSSSNSTLTGNIANNNGGYGINFQGSSNSNMIDNTAKLNTDGGIRLYSSSNNNTLIGNTASLNTDYGIYLLSSSNNNTLTSNTANSNTIYGIYLASSSNNTLYQNILHNNTNENVYDTATNNWNSSNLGNYFGDIVAIDIGGDGINDTEYSISGGSNKDYYPLIVASSATSPSTASGSDTLSFTVNTTLIDLASVGIGNITLYYSTDNATWTKHTNSTTGNFTFTASSSGTYYFRTVATDTYGMVENESLTYDSKTTVSISAPVTPSGGSGGGSGGGSSGEEYENVEVKDVVREYISKGDEASFNFKEEKNAIDVIKFTALKNAGTISATVEVLKDTSSLVKSAPSGKVYKNMNIWVGNSGFATSTNIADLSIGFKVEKSWIEENDIVESSIRLSRNHNDIWTSLSTSKSGEDDKYIYFEAETPGFSPFAITVEETEEITAVDALITEMTKVFDDTKPVTQTDVESDAEEEASGLPGFSIIMGILGIISAILVRRK